MVLAICVMESFTNNNSNLLFVISIILTKCGLYFEIQVSYINVNIKKCARVHIFSAVLLARANGERAMELYIAEVAKRNF